MKNQIMITASNSFSELGDNITAHYGIERDGTVRIFFDSDEVLDLPEIGNAEICSRVVAICLANGGAVMRVGRRFVPDVRVYEYCSCSPYRGEMYYEAFPTAQTNALRGLLSGLIKRYDIRFVYDSRLSIVCPRAVSGECGVFFASSYDEKNINIHPQPNIIRMIKKLAI